MRGLTITLDLLKARDIDWHITERVRDGNEGSPK